MVDWRIAFEETAETFIREFVEGHPAYRIASDAVTQGATNYVRKGTRDDAQVVFKYYSNPERWNNELFYLEHFSGTGLVPRVFDSVADRLTIMECLPGAMPRDGILETIVVDPAKSGRLSKQFGQAIGKLVATPLPTGPNGQFPPPGIMPFPWYSWSTDLREAVMIYVELGRIIQREVADFDVPMFDETLSLLAYQAEHINERRKVLFHDDIGNLYVENGEISGIFDFENCRLGTDVMQLGVGLGLCRGYGLDRQAFIDGYASITGDGTSADDHLSVLAMALLDGVIRICGEGGWQANDPAKAEAKRIAQSSLSSIRNSIEQFRDQIDLREWFPSLA